MSPNVFSCSEEWFTKLKREQGKLAVVTWKPGDSTNNQRLEKLQELERAGVACFVCDEKTCPDLANSLSSQPGEVIVFERGVEKGRVPPSADVDADVNKVKEMVR